MRFGNFDNFLMVVIGVVNGVMKKNDLFVFLVLVIVFVVLE